MTKLSPAAAKIVQAFDDRYELLGPLEDNWQEKCLIAALRAAAEHLNATSPWHGCIEFVSTGVTWPRNELLAIADEFEATEW